MISSPQPAADSDPEGAPTATSEAPKTKVLKELGWWDRQAVPVQATFALVAVLILFLLVFYGFALTYVHPFRWWPWSGTGKNATASQYDLTRNSATVAALLGGAVAIAVGLRRQKSTERTVELTQETAAITAQAYQLDQQRAQREEIDRLRDRYTTIAGQLGHDAAPIRLAGVYAMAALADDWLKRLEDNEAQVCIEVLCAYVRTPRHESKQEGRRADAQVREAITRVISEHLQDEMVLSWSAKSFDFTGASFTGQHSFITAHFDEHCRMNFDGAHIGEDCQITFFEANFNDGCTVTFDQATFHSMCYVDVMNCSFEEGARVTFNKAQFNTDCEVILSVSRFSRLCCVTFFDAIFSDGCAVRFDGASFDPECWVCFDRSSFNEGCKVTFDDARFSQGCDVSFNDLTVGQPSGPWGDGPPPLAWPPA